MVKNMEWNNVDTNPPPEGKDLLVYTDDDKIRVCVYFKGRWNTYLKVTHWQYPPKGPQKIEEEPKKRGRPKK